MQQSHIGDGVRLAVLLIVGAVVLASCGGGGVDSGGLTASDRNAAQAAMNALQPSNIPRLLVSLSFRAGLPPAACRVHLESKKPRTFKVYVFWIPLLQAESYSWLDMTLTKDVSNDKFHMGAESVRPVEVRRSGPGGKTVVLPRSGYNTPLSVFGRRQELLNKRMLMAHAGDAFSKPRATCQVLKNGYLQLVPNR
jgi:hypothetical protein